MTRPSGKIILSKRIGSVLYEIKEGRGLWVLAYNGSPIRYTSSKAKTKNSESKWSQNQSLAWVNKAHGINRVNKLNKMFNTNDFSLLEPFKE